MKIVKSKKGDMYIVGKTASGKPFHVSKHHSGHTHIKTADNSLHIDRPNNISKFFDIKDNEQKIIDKKFVFGLVANCPKGFSDVVVMDLSMNPTVLEKGIEVIIKRMESTIGGGMCPYDEGLLCMWRKFCLKGLNMDEVIKGLKK